LSWSTADVFFLEQRAGVLRHIPSIMATGMPMPEAKSRAAAQLPDTGVPVDGKLMRRSPQAAGTGYMVSRYSKYPELAYYFLQWLTGPTKGDGPLLIQSFWDPMRRSNLTHEAILAKFGQQFVEVTLENTKFVTSPLMLPGNEAYFHVLDKYLALVMQGTLSPEEAAKKIDEGWNKVTDDLGRQEQIKLWRSSVEMVCTSTSFDALRGLQVTTAPINVQHSARDVLIGHEHEHRLRHLFGSANALAGQDGRPILHNRVALRPVGIVQQRRIAAITHECQRRSYGRTHHSPACGRSARTPGPLLVL
jgi:hypothetical protein